MRMTRMFYLFYVLLTAFFLTACSEDISEYTSRVEELKNENDSERQKIDALKQQLEDNKNKGDLLKQKLDSLEKEMDSVVEYPELLTLSFLADDNAGIKKSVMCEIRSSGVINCWLPERNSDKKLIPRFTFSGTMVIKDSMEVESGATLIDFSEPVKLSVISSKGSKDYVIYVHSRTGLPVMEITTEDRKEITSREEYISAHMKLTEDVMTRSGSEIVEGDLMIKGRGHTTWGFDKKPYRLKFEEKISLLGEHKDKSWVLLANYVDKSMLRNRLAFYFSRISNLEWTPSDHFVELILNGEYLGTYQLCEKVKISNHRVAVGDDGFLFEIDQRAPRKDGTRYFYVDHIGVSVNIKDPEVEYDDSKFTYAKNFVTAADNALFSSNFTDPEEGWQKYMDMDSFVDWYLINELARNNDAIFFASCYMNLEKGGKLKMGPVWDFDLGFGNINYNDNFLCEGFWIKKRVDWYSRLYKDPAFVARLKERFTFFFNHKEEVLNSIGEDALYLRHSVTENESVWHTFYRYSWPNYDIWGSYYNEVQQMKDWLNKRFIWMKDEFDKL